MSLTHWTIQILWNIINSWNWELIPASVFVSLVSWTPETNETKLMDIFVCYLRLMFRGKKNKTLKKKKNNAHLNKSLLWWPYFKSSVLCACFSFLHWPKFPISEQIIFFCFSTFCHTAINHFEVLQKTNKETYLDHAISCYVWELLQTVQKPILWMRKIRQ